MAYPEFFEFFRWVPDYTSAYYGNGDFISAAVILPSNYVNCDHKWYISYYGDTKFIKEAILKRNGQVLQRRVFSYLPANQIQSPEYAEVKLIGPNNKLLVTWNYKLDKQGNIVYWSQKDDKNQFSPHAIYGLCNVEYIHDNQGRMIEARQLGSIENENKTLYAYDNNFNPIALLRNPLLSMFVYVPRAYVKGANVFGESNVGFNMFLPVSNIIRQEAISSLKGFPGLIRYHGAKVNEKTFTTSLEGEPSFTEITFSGCN